METGENRELTVSSGDVEDGYPFIGNLLEFMEEVEM